jgi:hypothetical protein
MGESHQSSRNKSGRGKNQTGRFLGGQIQQKLVDFSVCSAMAACNREENSTEGGAGNRNEEHVSLSRTFRPYPWRSCLLSSISSVSLCLRWLVGRWRGRETTRSTCGVYIFLCCLDLGRVGVLLLVPLLLPGFFCFTFVSGYGLGGCSVAYSIKFGGVMEVIFCYLHGDFRDGVGRGLCCSSCEVSFCYLLWRVL